MTSAPLDGLGRYAVARLSAHTLAMNASILGEASAAIVLLTALVVSRRGEAA